MAILIEPLEKAVQTLREALEKPFDTFIRDAIIQRFEYSYEIAWKTIRRVLEDEYSKEEIEPLPRKELFRYAAEKQLIREPLLWFEFHQAHNATSHAYDEPLAERTYETAKKFLPEVEFLLEQLKPYVGS